MAALTQKTVEKFCPIT